MSAFSDQEKEISKILLAGMKAGLSEARALERAGLLLTDARKVSIASTALLDVARLLLETRIRDIVPPGRPVTASDVKRSIAEWIETIVEDNQKKS